MSTQSFADLGVSSAVTGALTTQGITEPFAVQRMVIGDVLAGRDVLTKSPTGSGKTLAFGIPMMDRIESDGPRPAALVLAPTRELATQIAQDIRGIAHARALRVTTVYGGVGLTQQIKEAPRSHIVIATPGRLEDLLQRRAFRLDSIRLLVLDEADRMLDMGFRPAVDRIVRACPSRRQTLFFSATLAGEAGRVANEYTHDAVLHQHAEPPRDSSIEVEHRFLPVRGDTRVDALVRELEGDCERALVFVRTKRGADRLVKRLGTHGIRALAMHGNKSQRQREQALASFESGRVDTLVATDVAARGIDVEDISHVINFDPPGDRDTYVHRVGRTGRAGRGGVGITLVGEAERGEMAKLAQQLGIEHGLGGSRPHNGTRPQNAGRPQNSSRPPNGGRPGGRPEHPRPRRAQSSRRRPARGRA